MADTTTPQEMVKLAEHQAGVADVLAVYRRASAVLAQAAPYFQAMQPKMVSATANGTVPAA